MLEPKHQSSWPWSKSPYVPRHLSSFWPSVLLWTVFLLLLFIQSTLEPKWALSLSEYKTHFHTPVIFLCCCFGWNARAFCVRTLHRPLQMQSSPWSEGISSIATSIWGYLNQHPYTVHPVTTHIPDLPRKHFFGSIQVRLYCVYWYLLERICIQLPPIVIC